MKESVNGAVHAWVSATTLTDAKRMTPAGINDIVREGHGIVKPHPQNIGFLIGTTNRHKDCIIL